ncbi:hypothetical protein N7U66_19080 [Lacinutrix neustonica]|uniref:Uncharacterized protein n=1 Tax=Lacinutrix neustonica TaxID=2980107 RepID=A0A9E8SDM9_9FLAO|nr:hypothetical protein [Lacinutrix neustonica]WAC01922.1 hypothetical protein N7U66_19080 [Lacinutrix neustonica]
MVGDYLQGALWVNWSWRVNSPNVNQDILKIGLQRYTAYWAYERGINLNHTEFKIKVKKLDFLDWEWKKDYLSNQLEKKWLEAGALIWIDDKAELSLVKPIESF